MQEIQIITTQEFEKWLRNIADIPSRRRIILRIQRLTLGNFEDYKSVGQGIYELRLHFGSGYRIYFAKKGAFVVIILIGGDKSSQTKDITQSQQIWQEIKDDDIEKF